MPAPVETTDEKPKPAVQAKSSSDEAMVPDCDTRASDPARIGAGEKLAFMPCEDRINPTLLGPIRRTPDSRAAASTSCCQCTPCSPMQVKSPESTRAKGMPLAPAWRMAPATVGGGVVIATRSTLPGKASIEGRQGRPPRSTYLGLMGNRSPLKSPARTLDQR